MPDRKFHTSVLLAIVFAVNMPVLYGSSNENESQKETFIKCIQSELDSKVGTLESGTYTYRSICEVPGKLFQSQRDLFKSLDGVEAEDKSVKVNFGLRNLTKCWDNGHWDWSFRAVYEEHIYPMVYLHHKDEVFMNLLPRRLARLKASFGMYTPSDERHESCREFDEDLELGYLFLSPESDNNFGKGYVEK